MTTTVAQDDGTTWKPQLPLVTASLARLVASAEPAVVLSSLARLCVPVFSEECCIAVTEADRESYWICYPDREPSQESAVIVHRWLTGADRFTQHLGVQTLSTTITGPAEFGDPGYSGMMVHRWRSHQPTSADAALVQLMVDRAVDSVRSERLIRQLQRHQRQVENLQFALMSNREIGAAIGIVMTTRQVPAAPAFELLRLASQRRHVKLRVIAAEVVLAGALIEDGSVSCAQQPAPSAAPDQVGS